MACLDGDMVEECIPISSYGARTATDGWLQFSILAIATSLGYVKLSSRLCGVTETLYNKQTEKAA